jgi:transcriptional regulator with XRE-family HTH domain
MDDKQRLANLAANLKGLCRGVSIAVACREIGLNRQQFNKYLSGRHHPSRRSLALICGYFSVAEKDLYRNPAEFSATYHSAENWRLSAFAQLRRFQDFSSSMPASDENIRGYIGLYHRYHFSSIYHGTILRSIMEIYEKDGLLLYYCLERFPDLDDSSKTSYVFRYHGCCLWLDERLFFIDAEILQRNEMTFTAVVPVSRSKRRFLYGITTGVAATPFREPFSTRVVLEYQGPAGKRRDQMKAARTLDPDDRSIPLEVRTYLRSGTSGEASILRGG